MVLAVIFFAAVAGWYWLGGQSSSPTIPLRNTLVVTGTNVTVLSNTPASAVPPPDTFPVTRRSQQDVVGIGAVIKRDDNTGENMITGVLPNSPAAAAGLAGNFIIRKIDDILAEGMSLQGCVNLVRGPAGTKVRLELFDVDANEVRTVELTRQKLQLQTATPP